MVVQCPQSGADVAVTYFHLLWPGQHDRSSTFIIYYIQMYYYFFCFFLNTLIHNNSECFGEECTGSAHIIEYKDEDDNILGCGRLRG
jgi:hypothetical protein